jgi:hypothetical protein
MKAKDFDEKFDSGVDIARYLDLSKVRRPGKSKGVSMSISRFG